MPNIEFRNMGFGLLICAATSLVIYLMGRVIIRQAGDLVEEDDRRTLVKSNAVKVYNRWAVTLTMLGFLVTVLAIVWTGWKVPHSNRSDTKVISTESIYNEPIQGLNSSETKSPELRDSGDKLQNEGADSLQSFREKSLERNRK